MGPPGSGGLLKLQNPNPCRYAQEPHEAADQTVIGYEAMSLCRTCEAAAIDRQGEERGAFKLRDSKQQPPPHLLTVSIATVGADPALAAFRLEDDFLFYLVPFIRLKFKSRVGARSDARGR